jgi:hypothetical protein
MSVGARSQAVRPRPPVGGRVLRRCQARALRWRKEPTLLPASSPISAAPPPSKQGVHDHQHATSAIRRG